MYMHRVLERKKKRKNKKKKKLFFYSTTMCLCVLQVFMKGVLYIYIGIQVHKVNVL